MSSASHRIAIICEGQEEHDYLQKLIDKAVFNPNYKIKLINAKSVSNIYSRYTYLYQQNSYHVILIFCDTDKKSKSYYLELKDKIDEFHNNAFAHNIIIFGNPTTLQIFLSHFDKVEIKSQSKKTNGDLIKKLIGIENYDAHDDQRKELFDKINRRNYETMKKNLRDISTDDMVKPSTNFLKLIEYLESEDDSWIKEINDNYIKEKENTPVEN